MRGNGLPLHLLRLLRLYLRLGDVILRVRYGFMYIVVVMIRLYVRFNLYIVVIHAVLRVRRDVL